VDGGILMIGNLMQYITRYFLSTSINLYVVW